MKISTITPKTKTYYIAYSGGLDSTVLLHQMQQQNLPIHAIHINHQLQAPAEKWAEHCQQQCQQWQIPCTVKAVTAQKAPGQSPEAAARAARYTAFAEIISEGTALCTAHHQDDQAETLLLQLMRGAGVAGLAAMPECTPFAAGYLLRPLLSQTRAQLEDYAKQQQLTWIEDPSNQQIDFDRNYLRQHIMPLLRARWPSVSTTCARSAKHCAEAAKLINEIASQDYEGGQVVRCEIEASPNLTSNDLTPLKKIQISKIKLLSYERQQQLLRHWLAQNNLPTPSTAQLEQLQQQLLNSRQDAQPKLHWPGVNLRRYRDYLYLDAGACFGERGQVGTFDTRTSVKCPDLTPFTKTSPFIWNLQQPLNLSHPLRTLTAKTTIGTGISKQRLAAAPVTIRFREGGERCHPQGRQHSQTLKKLFQEYGIPTWERDSIPLLFCGEQLAAAIGYWVCVPFAAEKTEEAWEIT
jgi:tRNA(Ile)-lysidine synthase